MVIRYSNRTFVSAAALAVAACQGGTPEAGRSPSGADLADPTPGQIIVDPENPAWLSYEGNGPFFMCGPGDPEGFLYRGDRLANGRRRGDQLALIDKLGPTGANSLYVMAIRSHGGDGGPDENPFVDGDPAKGVSAPILAQWAEWFGEMERWGVTIVFFFYDDGARVWDTGDRMGSEERAFIRTLVKAFEGYRKLIWVVAEEYSEALSRERVANIAAEIRAADDHDHVIAVHQLRGLAFDFADDPHIDQFAVQTSYGKGVDSFHQSIIRAFDRAAGAYNLSMSEAHPDHGTGPAANTRRVNWAAAMAGAYVMVLGWDVANTPIAALEQCGHMVRFMEATRVNRMSPRDDLAWGSTGYVLAEPGVSYIAYAANALAPVGLKGMETGRYDLTWLDLVTGASIEHTETSVDAGDQLWPSPEGIGPELAVYVRKTGLEAETEYKPKD